MTLKKLSVEIQLTLKLTGHYSTVLLQHGLTPKQTNSRLKLFLIDLISHTQQADAVTQSLTNKSQSWCDLGIRENCLILSSPQLPVNDLKIFLKNQILH